MNKNYYNKKNNPNDSSAKKNQTYVPHRADSYPAFHNTQCQALSLEDRLNMSWRGINVALLETAWGLGFYTQTITDDGVLIAKDAAGNRVTISPDHKTVSQQVAEKLIRFISSNVGLEPILIDAGEVCNCDCENCPVDEIIDKIRQFIGSGEDEREESPTPAQHNTHAATPTNAPNVNPVQPAAPTTNPMQKVDDPTEAIIKKALEHLGEIRFTDVLHNLKGTGSIMNTDIGMSGIRFNNKVVNAVAQRAIEEYYKTSGDNICLPDFVTESAFAGRFCEGESGELFMSMLVKKRGATTPNDNGDELYTSVFTGRDIYLSKDVVEPISDEVADYIIKRVLVAVSSVKA